MNKKAISRCVPFSDWASDAFNQHKINVDTLEILKKYVVLQKMLELGKSFKILDPNSAFLVMLWVGSELSERYGM